VDLGQDLEGPSHDFGIVLARAIRQQARDFAYNVPARLPARKRAPSSAAYVPVSSETPMRITRAAQCPA